MGLEKEIIEGVGLNNKTEIFWNSERGLYTSANNKIINVGPIGMPLIINKTRGYTKVSTGNVCGEHCYGKRYDRKASFKIVGAEVEKIKEYLSQANYFCVSGSQSIEHDFGESKIAHNMGQDNHLIALFLFRKKRS